MKILDLFNEYNLSPEMTWWEMEQPRTEKDWNTMSRIYKAYIVSKDFWWIKWLVDNDKINMEEVPMRCELYYQTRWIPWNVTDDTDILIMLLAIQPKPIEFLISLLK